MKTKNELLAMLLALLTEVEARGIDNVPEEIITKMTLLYDILGEDVPEEYWERIESVTFCPLG